MDPVAGTAYTFDDCLYDFANPGLFKSSPTIAAGDFVLYRDGALVGNLTTLPTAAGMDVTIALSAAETTGASRLIIIAHDQAGSEWGDRCWVFQVQTAAQALAGSAMTLTAGERTSIADALLTRNFAAVTGEAARSMLNALRFLRNKWSIAGPTLTVTKEDDAATAWTSVLTTDAAATPITSSDPA